MLFTESIQSWRDWGRVFQSIPAFTPLAREICRREGLPWAELTPLTPGTNGVFRCGEAVLKIFFPKESGLDPALDFSTELAAARQAASWGVPTPPVLAHGCLQDKYRFYYIATRYSPGKEAGPWLRDATPAQQAAFVERLRQLLPQLHRPTQALPRRDLRQEARGNFRLEKLAPSLREEVLARLEGLPLEPAVLTHGDLTGENLLVQEDGSFVVIDWADAHLAPAWYELGPLAFELLAGEGRLWRQLAAGAEELFVERLLDCLCLHDFGPDFLTNLAHRQGRAGFRSLGEVAECLRSQFAGVAPQASRA